VLDPTLHASLVVSADATSELHATSNAEAIEHVTDVILDGGPGNTQSVRNFGIRESVRREKGDLSLPWRQPRKRRSWWLRSRNADDHAWTCR
jgi:hypothetical protein